jgi:phosphoglycerate dehydrogenase-like enzyme
MQASARLINVGRGPIVDTAALVAALERGELAGAALDVFEQEPLPSDHPLWRLPNVMVSAHLSGDIHGWRNVVMQQFLDNLDRWIAGEPLENQVDKHLGFIASRREVDHGR